MFVGCMVPEEFNEEVKKVFTSKTDRHPHPLIDWNGGDDSPENSFRKAEYEEQKKKINKEEQEEKISIVDIIYKHVQKNAFELQKIFLIVGFALIGICIFSKFINWLFKANISFIVIVFIIMYFITYWLMSIAE